MYWNTILDVTKEYTEDPSAPATCPYIHRLIEEYMVIRFSVNQGIYYFYITPILTASLDGEPSKQVIQQKIIQQYI
jgi:hypothetical protein